MARGRIEFASELLAEAEPLAERMEDAASAIRTRAVADRIRHLVKVARDIFAAIERDPLRLDRVRRFLTYYLPRAAEIAEAYRALETSTVPDVTRLAATGDMIDRLDVAFTRYAANLQDADLDKLDIELKLLKSSLDEDLGPAQPAAPVETKRGTS
jgi:5-bromo-4-chloroindolyl phosphate hydrolysis protein